MPLTSVITHYAFVVITWGMGVVDVGLGAL